MADKVLSTEIVVRVKVLRNGKVVTQETTWPMKSAHVSETRPTVPDPTLCVGEDIRLVPGRHRFLSITGEVDSDAIPVGDHIDPRVLAEMQGVQA